MAPFDGPNVEVVFGALESRGVLGGPVVLAAQQVQFAQVEARPEPYRCRVRLLSKGIERPSGGLGTTGSKSRAREQFETQVVGSGKGGEVSDEVVGALRGLREEVVSLSVQVGVRPVDFGGGDRGNAEPARQNRRENDGERGERTWGEPRRPADYSFLSCSIRFSGELRLSTGSICSRFDSTSVVGMVECVVSHGRFSKS